MLEVSVTERARQQGRRLQLMRDRHNVSKGRLLDALGFKTTQAYDLYEKGTSVIRLDRVDDWASAFGVDLMTFLGEILGVYEIQTCFDAQAQDVPYSLRDDLRGEVPEDVLEQAEEIHGVDAPADQQERARHYRHGVADQIDATRAQNRPA